MPEVKANNENATAPASTRISAPSEMYFNVPYTDGFTTITQQEQYSVAKKAPMSSGYESIVSTIV